MLAAPFPNQVSRRRDWLTTLLQASPSPPEPLPPTQRFCTLSRRNIQPGAGYRHTRQRTKSRPVARILVPLDFSAESKHVLHYAAALSRNLGAGLILLHVVEPLVCQADFG